MKKFFILASLFLLGYIAFGGVVQKPKAHPPFEVSVAIDCNQFQAVEQINYVANVVPFNFILYGLHKSPLVVTDAKLLWTESTALLSPYNLTKPDLPTFNHRYSFANKQLIIKSDIPDPYFSYYYQSYQYCYKTPSINHKARVHLTCG